MNKKALLAVLLALMLPLTCYLIIRQYSDAALEMPQRFLPDSITTVQQRGKQVTDTSWHKLSNFTLTNQLGETVTLNKYSNKIIIANFFFTHCPTICPPLTLNMKALQQSITNSKRVGDKTNHSVQFLSFSIDPERDSVPKLKEWADRFQINPEQWDLLTGDKKTIYDLALNDMKLAVVDGGGIDTSFIHTDHFVLIDSSHNIRGYYHGLDSADIKKLSKDIILLTLEKNPNKTSALAGKLKLLAIVFLIAAMGVGIFLIIFKKNKHVEAGIEKK
ncbi:MAG: SCO family protein [Niabella sp.]